MKALVAGWFSFRNGHATAGDLLARDVVCKWLDQAGWQYDVALTTPFSGGVSLHDARPAEYAAVIFVCGPFEKKLLEAKFLGRFARCHILGVNLTMPVPLDEWNPFDHVMERNSSRCSHPDIVFLSDTPRAPLVGRCLVESYDGAIDEVANAAIERLLTSRDLAIIPIDTRLDTNTTGLQSPAQIEALVARMDVVVTTRLHGMVLALKNGVPAIAIDPEPSGAKIMRQAEIIAWPFAFAADAVNVQVLEQALEYCLTENGRRDARRCAERAVKTLEGLPGEFIGALTCAVQPSPKQSERSKFSEAFGCNLSVAVIITTCGNAVFLKQAIESVVDQNHPADEIIIVGDGAVDSDTALVAAGPSIDFIRQPDQGLASARNAGLSAARSDTILFLTADDRLLPSAVEDSLACLARDPRYGLVFGGHRRNEVDWLPNQEDRSGAAHDAYLDLLVGKLIGIHPAAVLYSRRRLTEIGGFDPTLQRCEDYDVYLRMARIHPVGRHQNPVADVRPNTANAGGSRHMLRWALKVHMRQKSFALTRPDLAEAWWRGFFNWRSHYSDQALNSAKRAWSQSGCKLQAVQLWLHGMAISPRHGARKTMHAVLRSVWGRNVGHRIL